MKLGKLLALSAASLLMVTACGKQGDSKNSGSGEDTISITSEEEQHWGDEAAALLEEYIGHQVPYVEMGANDWEWDDKYKCVSIYGTEFSNSLVLDYSLVLEHAGYVVDVYDYYGDGELSVDAAIKYSDEEFVFVEFYNMGEYSELDVYLTNEDPFAVSPDVEMINLINETLFDGEGETGDYYGYYALYIEFSTDSADSLEALAQEYDGKVSSVEGMNVEDPLHWYDSDAEYYAEYSYNEECGLSFSAYSDISTETGEEYYALLFCGCILE